MRIAFEVHWNVLLRVQRVQERHETRLELLPVMRREGGGVMFNAIERELDGVKWSVSIQHLPDRKRPCICVSHGGEYFKVGEVTDELLLMVHLSAIFEGAKVVDE